ncbi:MAG: sigma-70 family RNA polymerase sigma factor [Bacteroidota bacterium]
MKAFEEIVKDHSPKIYYFLRRMGLEHEDADEILQDVFILLWRDLKNGHGLDMANFRLYQHAIKKVPNSINENNTKDRLVFILKQYEGFDFGEISDMTGMEVGDVRESFKSGLKLEAVKMKGGPY